MKNTALPPIFGLLPLLGLGGCGMLSGDRTPEVTNAARLNVAMAAEASGDNQMALQIYATALAKDPSDTNAAVQYARALINNRQVGLARELLSRQLAARPGQPDLSREFGTIEVLQGQAASAVSRFDIALNANPSDVRALVNKGIALDMLGRHAEAQQLYHRADGISPDDPAVRNNLAMSLMLHGRSQEAGVVFQNATSDTNSTPRMRNNMAVVAAANGDMARARQLTAGEISDAELQSLASQLRTMPVQEAGPAAAAPPAVDAAPMAAAQPAQVFAPTAAAVTVPALDTGVSGAIPLSVPGQQGVSVTPTSAPAAAPRVTPTRIQDKRGAGRLNMTQSEPGTAVTPAVIARVIEQSLEKQAAFIGAAPSVDPGPALIAGTQIMPAVAASPLRVRAAVAAVHPSTLDTAPRRGASVRMGYTVQLASVGSEAGAQREWRALNARMPFLMMGRDATMDSVTRADGRSFWLLRTPGFTDISAARQFCDELKLVGRDCFVTGGRSAQTAALLRPAPIVAAPAPEAIVAPVIQSPEG